MGTVTFEIGELRVAMPPRMFAIVIAIYGDELIVLVSSTHVSYQQVRASMLRQATVKCDVNL